ncbi:hypothetical protein E2C01_049666 [Portunus trituberculatus]|uniref:Uncharacterized protein n=1 Tax=Portunus trituberculatus TaxID=210409 RepID=A0A5B7GA31_PORTR|nr:hypothetical protein [Portunus trituberculatus]
MTMFPRVGEKRRIDDIGLEDEEAIGGLCRYGRPAVTFESLPHIPLTRVSDWCPGLSFSRVEGCHAAFVTLCPTIAVLRSCLSSADCGHAGPRIS